MERLLGVAALLVAVLLVATGSYPATLGTTSYQDSSRFEHRLDAVGSPGYEERVEDVRAETGRNASELPAMRYDELPPDVQRVFDRTLADPPNRLGTRTYTPPFCKDGVLACPDATVRDLPAELEYRTTDGEYAALVVETDDDRYLFSTPAAVPGHGTPVLEWSWFHRLAFGPVFGGVALFLVSFGSEPFVGQRRSVAAAVAGAATLAAGGITGFGLGHLLLAAGVSLVTLAPAPLADPRARSAAVALGATIVAVAVGPAYAEVYVGAFGPSARQRGLVLALAVGGPIALSLVDRRWRTADETTPGSAATGPEEA